MLHTADQTERGQGSPLSLKVSHCTDGTQQELLPCYRELKTLALILAHKELIIRHLSKHYASERFNRLKSKLLRSPSAVFRPLLRAPDGAKLSALETMLVGLAATAGTWC